MKTSMLFLSAFLCAGLSFAQTEKPDTTTENQASTVETSRKSADVGHKISSPRLIGPRAKNPFATGRAGYSPSAFEAVAPSTSVRLFGPAYKNRKPVPAPDTTRVTEPVSKPVLTGPRYKNRYPK